MSHPPLRLAVGNALSDLEATVPSWERVLLGTLDCMLDRFERDPDTPFLDTKIDIFDGSDLYGPLPGTNVDGRDTVYAWIQGRGLEALCGHMAWIERTRSVPVDRKAAYRRRIRSMVGIMARRLEEIRAQHGGRLFFYIDRDGRFFRFDGGGRKRSVELDPTGANFSDLFYAKGLFASGILLEDAALEQSGRELFERVVRAIDAGRFVSDQQSPPPAETTEPPVDRVSHGPRMIALGGFALLAAHPGGERYAEDGLRFVEAILARHVIRDGRFPGLEECDFLEFVTPGGEPCAQDGHVLSDPGHALEFVGLAGKLLACLDRHPDEGVRSRARACAGSLPPILEHVFAQGFRPAGGICKLYSLSARAPYDPHMPWWSLPETMRAALFARRTLADPDRRAACREIARQCSNAYFENYVNPDVHDMAYQSLDADGTPVRVVPATRDLDPGYHTGLSIIDYLDALAEAASERSREG